MRDELIALLKILLTALESQGTAEAPPKQTRSQKAAEKLQTATPTPAPAPAAQTAPGITHKDCVTELTELMQANHATAANLVETNAGKKGAKLGEIPVEKLPGFLEEVRAALAKLKAAPPSLI